MNDITCPYCNKVAEFISTKEFYGKDYGTNIYLCRPCDAYVGTHGKGKKPLGTMANNRLRNLRKMAHNRFDPLWRKRKMSRGNAYKWLSEQMNIPVKECHIGMFNEEQCLQVVKIMGERNE